ncbi:unnamed protein product [Caenorhabditis auriculariae]|uniref:tRNA-intron lyase n=1 Tax=Caenorhabditis auriculariae TaxID=2777116 RepID=A0A8S1H5N4_9PELO|nr:unnamed protein product [Caenorhabditis auriculariae]
MNDREGSSRELLTIFDEENESESITIRSVNGDYFISTRKEALLAESKARIVVSDSDRPPYPVLPELVLLLVEFGHAVVRDASSGDLLQFQDLVLPEDPKFEVRRFTARDFWRKGYFLASGSRFGGDLMAYMGSPNQLHSEFVILCSADPNVNVLSLISIARCCNQVKKKLVLALLKNTHTPYYLSLSWLRPETH